MSSLVDLQHTQPSSQGKECGQLGLGKGIMGRQQTQADFHVNYVVVQTLHPKIIEWLGSDF